MEPGLVGWHPICFRQAYGTTEQPEGDKSMTISNQRIWDRISGIGKFAAGVVVGASLTCAVASATQLSRHDGLFWKGLGNQDKTAYVAGYSDAMHTSLGKLDNLRVAAALFHWKGAGKILGQVERGLDLSDLPPEHLISYLDNVYSNPRYGDFNVTMAIEAATMRGTDFKPGSGQTPLAAADSSNVKK